MEFAKRLLWYLTGALFGIILVFSWFGSRTDISCNYFPDARVKGDLLKKTINYDSTTISLIHKLGVDTSSISKLLVDGDVIFSKSDTKLDSCKTYFIQNDELDAIFENCDSIVNIIDVNLKSI